MQICDLQRRVANLRRYVANLRRHVANLRRYVASQCIRGVGRVNRDLVRLGDGWHVGLDAASLEN